VRLLETATNSNFSFQNAVDHAKRDWENDVKHFSESAHVTQHIENIRMQFQKAAAEQCQALGLSAVFHHYDTDGTGDLDFEEFVMAVRNELELEEAFISKEELHQIFTAVDDDESGTLHAQEFVSWLWSSGGVKNKDRLVDNRRKGMEGGIMEIKSKFKELAGLVTEVEGWKYIFAKHDDDGSGELDEDEFKTAVRSECELAGE